MTGWIPAWWRFHIDVNRIRNRAYAKIKYKPLTSAPRGKIALGTLEMQINSILIQWCQVNNRKRDSFIACCFEFIGDTAQIIRKH